MSITHNPGPWEAFEIKGSYSSEGRDFIAIHGADGYAIARLLLPVYRNKQADGSDDVISQQQWANARVIIAAPELLRLVRLFTTLHMEITDDHEELEEKLFGFCREVLDRIGAAAVPS